MNASNKRGIGRIIRITVCLIAVICLMAGCSSGNTAETIDGKEKTTGQTIDNEAVQRDNVAGPEEILTETQQNEDVPDDRPEDINTSESTDPAIEVGETEEDADPDTEAVIQGAEEAIPGTEEAMPGTEAAIPGTEAAIPGTEAAIPAAEAVLPDTTPPVFKEYRSHLVYIGDTVSYRGGVILTDDSGEEPVLTIDSSKVNLKEVGEYPLTYIATDSAGNTATCEVTVVVREPEDVTQEMLDAKADEIIEKVLGDEPRDITSLEKLFKWTKKNIHYVNYFEQNDEISAAWEGLVYERGDCFVYACASKELLSRAGFTNDMIKTSRHYWNLVDLGEGWYHYDTCPRKDKPYFFMWGDEQLMEYSRANGNSHDYDHTKWPDVMP